MLKKKNQGTKIFCWWTNSKIIIKKKEKSSNKCYKTSNNELAYKITFFACSRPNIKTDNITSKNH